MAQIATSIEQGKKLLELGFSPESADMFWQSVDTKGSDYFLCEGTNIAITGKLFSFRKGLVVPAWSLSALLELLPDTNCGVEKENGEYLATYLICGEPSESGEYSGNNPIMPTFEMLCHLTENGYIRNGK